MSDDDSRERDEIELMLPWYEKGTLSADEMRRVDAYLEAHPEMRTYLVLIREEMEHAVAANEALGMPGTGARDKLAAQIAAEPGGAQQSPRLMAWLQRWLPDGVSPGLALAAVAAALVIVLQLAALVSQDGDYRVAGGDEQAAPAGTYLLIRFADNAGAADIAALLQSVGGAIVDGPKPGGVYKLRIATRALSPEEREAVMARLRAKTDLVTFLAPSG
ncbi:MULTISPECIES: hypothetical protein [Rhodomicrobium]|uniref:hypothetical protein n=1 Tax=Rhodomicrobium TaxID=1068 RepID=UPI000F73D013|nr:MULTISPECIES: hypothetical protein [Rhodomicrobium]